MSVEGFRRLAEESEAINFQVTHRTPKIEGDHLYYRDSVTSRISLNKYKGVILAPALPNEPGQFVLRCRAECRSCLSATPTASTQRCRPAAFDLEPEHGTGQRFLEKLRRNKSTGANVTFRIRHRPIAPKYGDQEWRCRSESLM